MPKIFTLNDVPALVANQAIDYHNTEGVSYPLSDLFLRRRVLSIGRDPKGDISLLRGLAAKAVTLQAIDKVSNHHGNLRLARDGNSIIYEDFDSLNGTVVVRGTVTDEGIVPREIIPIRNAEVTLERYDSIHLGTMDKRNYKAQGYEFRLFEDMDRSQVDNEDGFFGRSLVRLFSLFMKRH